MKIVQTFWSGNKRNIIHDPFGWYDSSYHIQSWALSCNLLRRLYDDVELYTDEVGYDLLIKKLQLPYSKVHVVLDELNHYSSSVWALSKIRTYSLQDTPFIHIDGDVFLWKKFSDELTTSDFVIQNREVGNQYFDTSWKTLEEQLTFIPDEIQQHRQKESAVNVFNFGIFGGQNTSMIKGYAQKAFEFVDRNTHSLDAIKHLNFNIFFEQYLFYCMAQDQQVIGYFNHDIVADKYEGLANFEDASRSRNYLHLLGDYKKKEIICKNMSRQLAVEFPEQYLTCLKVMESHEEKIFSLQYQGTSSAESTQQTSFTQQYQSIPYIHKFSKVQEIINQYTKTMNIEGDTSFTSKEQLLDVMHKLNDPEITRLVKHRFKVEEYLNSLTDLDFSNYAQWEYNQQKLYPKFLDNSDNFSIKSPDVSTIIQEPFLVGDDYSLDPEEASEALSRLILPSSTAPYFKEIILEQIEQIILDESKNGTNIQQLILSMQEYFDAEELKNIYDQYEQLIRSTVKRLIYLGALHLVVSEEDIPSRRIDTNLECL